MTLRILAAGVAIIAMSSTGWTFQAPNGAAIFQRHCAVCHHENSGTRAPLPSVLRQMSRRAILGALENGVMRAQGSQLTAAERVAVTNYLSRVRAAASINATAYCAAKSGPLADDSGWNGWGADASNSRFQPADVARLSPDEIPRLRLKWAFGFPGASSAIAQPAVIADRVFVGSQQGIVYSLDAHSGCIYWTFKARATVRTAVSVDFANRSIYFGDTSGNVYALNAANCSLLWTVRAEPGPMARIVGSPVLFDGHLFVPLSSSEEAAAANPKYPCCSSRGGVVALDAQSGKQIWRAYTIQATPQRTGRRNTLGIGLWGPAGAAVWSSPTLDLQQRAVYVATGNDYTDPPTRYSEAIIAYSMDSGKLLWSRQLTHNDRWNIACITPHKENCPKNPGPDSDFGSPPILRSLPDGHRLVIAGQKSGMVYALDPDRKGKLVWVSRIGKGGPLGGIEWGGAADRQHVYYPLSDWDEANPFAGGGLFALKIATGKRLWYAPPAKPACAKQPGCSAAQIAPVTVIPGVVFSGSQDGHLRAYDAHDGKVIWDFDTLCKFQTVNGVPAHGGSLNATGPVVVDGMLYVEAGYTGGIPGNALLAFSPGGR